MFCKGAHLTVPFLQLLTVVTETLVHLRKSSSNTHTAVESPPACSLVCPYPLYLSPAHVYSILTPCPRPSSLEKEKHASGIA